LLYADRTPKLPIDEIRQITLAAIDEEKIFHEEPEQHTNV
jgi:hypothetical protein